MATDTQTKGGPRSGSPGALGIERASYIAMHSPDPAAAAKFAVDFMGLDLVHVDAEGRHYLAARGFDPYSLVYTPGEQGIDHVSYVVRGKGALAAAERALTAAGVDSEQIAESPMWRKAPLLLFHTPSGAAIELATGIAPALPLPIGSRCQRPARRHRADLVRARGAAGDRHDGPDRLREQRHGPARVGSHRRARRHPDPRVLPRAHHLPLLRVGAVGPQRAAPLRLHAEERQGRPAGRRGDQGGRRRRGRVGPIATAAVRTSRSTSSTTTATSSSTRPRRRSSSTTTRTSSRPGTSTTSAPPTSGSPPPPEVMM